MAQKTAVEWLLGTLEQNDIIDLDSVDSNEYYDIINQAKAMEKEQIMNACENFSEYAYHKNDFEYYYNETYKK